MRSVKVNHNRSLRKPHQCGGASLLFSFTCLLVLSTGCQRAYYRLQADNEVYCLVDTVSERTGEAEPGFGIEIDQRSRMYDPNNPDFPPMPPDDPEAHSYMHCVDCKRGWPCWHRNGDTPYVASPYWQQYLPRDEQGDLVLDLHGAVDVALVNSTDYQEQLEELYLSALDVTFERFRLDTQFYGGSSIFYTADGANRPGSGGESSSVLNVSPFDPTNRLRATRMFAGGGELVVGLANSLVWEFSGPNAHSVNTLLDFSFVQPLLRAGGRARVLERLTIAERTLLANVRQMERYRRGFYTEVVTGRDAGQGPRRRGGFFGGAGLEGFSGVGGGGFGRVGSSGGIGSGGTGAGAAGAGGYMGLLQSMQEIRNQEANVSALRVSLAQLRAFADAGRLGNRAEVQIGLAASALYNAESRLLTSKAQFQSALDSFKLTLGLPPNLPLKIDDRLLDQFNLIDPQLVEIQRVVERLLDATRKVEFAQLDHEDALLEPPAEDGNIAPPAPAPKPADVDVEALLIGASALRKEIEAHLRTVDADLEKLESRAAEREKSLKELTTRDEVRRQDIDANLLDVGRFKQRLAALKEDYQALLKRFACDWETIDALKAAYEAGEDLSTVKIPCRDEATPLLDPDAPVEDNTPVVADPAPGADPKPALIPDPFEDEELVRDRTPWTTALTELSRNLLELTLVQARMRTNSVVLQPIDLSSEKAFQIASRNRRDWANARAELVNAWRLIQFNANDLKSGLDLTFSGDVGNLGKNPVNLDASTGRLRVGLRFDAPLTRLAERNVYRQSLIEYQQARRNYYSLVDRIQAGLRQSIRTINLNTLNFELRREAVQVALRRYHFTILDLDRPASRTAPAGPGQLAEGGEDFGATTARDLVDALSDLQNAQNDFLSVWVNYEVQRMSLDFDLGTMQLDPYGQWIDPGQEVGHTDLPVVHHGGHGEYDISEYDGNDGLGFYDPDAVGSHGRMLDEGCTDLELLQLPELLSPEEVKALEESGELQPVEELEPTGPYDDPVEPNLHDLPEPQGPRSREEAELRRQGERAEKPVAAPTAGPALPNPRQPASKPVPVEAVLPESGFPQSSKKPRRLEKSRNTATQAGFNQPPGGWRPVRNQPMIILPDRKSPE